MACVGFICHGVYLSLDYEFVIVQIAAICCYAEVVTHIFTAQAFFASHQCFIKLFAVACTDDVGAGIAKQFLHCLSQVANGRCICLLDKKVSGVSMFKGKFYQVYCFIKVHQEACHIRISDGNRVACMNLVNEQRNNAAAATHYVAIAGAADYSAATLSSYAGVGIDYVLHHSLGDAHGVDGISSFVGGKADYALYASFDGCVQHVVGAFDVSFYGLHGEEFAAWYLLECCCMEDVVNTGHSIADAAVVAHVTYVKFYFFCCIGMRCLQAVTHVVLFLFVTGEDADFTDIGLQKMLQHRVAKGTGATGNHQSCSRKCGHV